MRKLLLLKTIVETLIHLFGLVAWVWLYYTDIVLAIALSMILWSANISSRHSPRTRELSKELERELEDKLK